MNDARLKKGAVVKLVFASAETLLLLYGAFRSFSNDGTSNLGYWGVIAVEFTLLSPIIVYVSASLAFSVANLCAVCRCQYTKEELRRYYGWSKAFFIWGLVAGGAYGIAPIFLLENIFLFRAYCQKVDALHPTKRRRKL